MFSCETKTPVSLNDKKLNYNKINQSVCFPKRTWKAIKVLFKKYRTLQYGDHTHIYLSSDECKSPADVWVCLRIPMDQRKQILGLTEGTLLEGGLRRVIPDSTCTFWTLSSAAQRHQGLITGALPAAQGFRFLLGCSRLWGDANAGYHLLDLLLVLQDVGLDCADLVLLVFD